MSACLYACLSICLSTCLSTYPTSTSFVCLPYPPAYIPTLLFPIWLSTHLSVWENVLMLKCTLLCGYLLKWNLHKNATNSIISIKNISTYQLKNATLYKMKIHKKKCGHLSVQKKIQNFFQVWCLIDTKSYSVMLWRMEIQCRYQSQIVFVKEEIPISYCAGILALGTFFVNTCCTTVLVPASWCGQWTWPRRVKHVSSWGKLGYLIYDHNLRVNPNSPVKSKSNSIHI